VLQCSQTKEHRSPDRSVLSGERMLARFCGGAYHPRWDGGRLERRAHPPLAAIRSTRPGLRDLAIMGRVPPEASGSSVTIFGTIRQG